MVKKSFLNIFCDVRIVYNSHSSVHKVLLEHSRIFSPHIAHGFFGTVTAELSGYDRDLLAQKRSLNIYHLVFL